MPASSRLPAIVEALPLEPGLRVLEIGCGPGVAARLVAARPAHGSRQPGDSPGAGQGPAQ